MPAAATEAQATSRGEHAFAFGPFRLLPRQRLLLEGDKPVRLGSRALDLLIAMVEHPGEVVGRDELMARVWPNTHVDEGNLKFQIGALRRTLGGGNRYLLNVPGRGYSFVAPVTRSESPRSPAQQTADVKHAHNLPAHLTRMLGRADTVSTLATRLSRQRLITIAGPGGIGKTTVALAVAEALIPACEHGVWLVDLAPLSDPRLVPSALAAVLSLEIRSDNPLPGLIAGLKDKETLLVLDNCEHVIDEVAVLTSGILKGAPDLHILATSREPLRAEGEHVSRLSPLGSPPGSAGLTAAEALRFPAVQLFVERVAGSLDEFELSDADAPIVAGICRNLDGIPLAIEFAAARVEAFGMHGLGAHLDERLRLLTSGRRTAMARHRTLSTALDWSYRLLTEDEQMALRRLAIFAGGFTLDAAGAVAADDNHPEVEVVDQVAELVAKSLVVADVTDAEPRYRLLDTTRTYALEKLVESGEFERAARRHAEFYLDLFERSQVEWETEPATEWLATNRERIDNLRAALDWAFSPDGDATIGVALTVASERLWFGLSLMDECRTRVERALARTESGAGGGRRHQMQLYAILGAALYYTKGPSPEECAAWTNALELAERLDDIEYRLRALWGLWRYRMGNAEYRPALTLAQRFSGLLPNQADKTDMFAGERMLGFSLFCLGDLSNARNHFEHVLGSYPASPPQSQTGIGRFQLDVAATVRATLAQVLWLQGFPDQAMRMAEENVVNTRHVLSLCNALDGACAVALAIGDLTKARRYVGLLLEHSAKLTLGLYRAFGHLFEGQLLIQCGDVAAGSQRLRAALDELADAGIAMRRAMGLGMLAEALAPVGRVTEGLVVVDEALTQCEYADSRWNLSELLRIKGDLILLDDSRNGTVSAEDLYQQGVDWARRQGALSWELRCATGLARLQRDRGHHREARELLASIYDRFTEGFGTADLQAAKQLLDELTDVVRP
jgi:predicted ATPase/DNA-binding winged helix-turn-helix (wHTH) protein